MRPSATPRSTGLRHRRLRSIPTRLAEPRRRPPLRLLPVLGTLLEPGGLQAQFQPVFDASAPLLPIHYLEGLVRGPRGSSVQHPEQLFAYARLRHVEAEMDRACVRAVLAAACSSGRAVGVNVRQSTLSSDRGFARFLSGRLSASRLDPGSLVLEILEQGEIDDRRVLQHNLRELHAIGVRLAVDDFGTGQANYALLLHCRPEYLKVAAEFVRGCHADPRRQALLRAIVALARQIGASVVAEGVEHPAELAFVRGEGITLLQGYLLGRPARCDSWPPALCA
jgi:EAL domain-containing protein (putative c-di-GMP-specific phosphodiesterase class I)